MKISRRIAISLLGSLVLSTAVASDPVSKKARVVTVDGSITEIVIALGAEDRIVGVDSTSLFAPQVRSLPVVGYLRALSSEGLLSLNPDIVITTSDAGPESVLSQVSLASVQVEALQNEYTQSGISNKIRKIGEILNLSEEATHLNEQVSEDFAKVQKNINKYPKSYTVMFVMDSGERGLMVSGKRTRAAGIMKMAGLKNAFSEIEGYKALTPEAAIMANPDIVLVFHSQLPIDKIKSNPAIKLTIAAKQNRVFNVDQLNLLNFGSSTGKSILQLQSWLESK